jgi:hypothetical protein
VLTDALDMQVNMQASSHVHVVTAIPEQVSPAARSSVTECFAALTFETCRSVPSAELEISGAPTLSLALVSTLCTQAVDGTIEQQAPCDRSDSEAISLASTVTTLEAVMLGLNASFAQIEELVGVWFTYSDTDHTLPRQNCWLDSNQVAPLDASRIQSSFPELASHITSIPALQSWR